MRRLTNGRGVDIALDAQGGASLKKSFRSLAPTGRVFAFGAASLTPDGTRNVFSLLKGVLQMPLFELFPLRLMGENRGIFGVNMGHLWDESAILLRQLGDLLVLYEQGAIKPVIDARVPFDRAADAHRRLMDRVNVGKVLLIP